MAARRQMCKSCNRDKALPLRPVKITGRGAYISGGCKEQHALDFVDPKLGARLNDTGQRGQLGCLGAAGRRRLVREVARRSHAVAVLLP